MRWILLCSIPLLFSCGVSPIYTQREKDFFATCTAHLSDFKYNTGMAQDEVRNQLGAPARTFQAKENTTGKVVIVDEYREKRAYEKESKYFKNMWGTPEKYMRQGCERMFIAYDMQDNLAIGRVTYLSGADIGREINIFYDEKKRSKFTEQ